MPRRFIYFQGRPLQAFKVLYQGSDSGYYITGDRQVPTLVSPLSPPGFSFVFALGICSTGPGLNDWVVGGYGQIGSSDLFLFWDHTGIIRSLAIPDGLGTRVFSAGNFSKAHNDETGEASDYWASPDDNGSGTGGAAVFGFILPEVIATVQGRQSLQSGMRTNNITQDPALTHALAIDGDATRLWFADGSSVLSDFDPALIPKTSLDWPYAYVTGVNFAFTDNMPGVAGTNTTTLDTYLLDELGGAVLQGTQEINYYSPGGSISPFDASYSPTV